MSRLGFPQLFSGGLITNYFCPSRCGHCLYNRGPSRGRDYIDPDTAEGLLRTVRETGCPAVHIGGGEPFLDPEGLGRVLLDTSHFHVDLYGNYIPGLCSGLAVDAADLGRPLPPEKYPLLTLLYRRGIAGLKELAQAERGYAPQRDSYLGACDLCTEIRGFLVRSGYSRSLELSPREFYDPENVQPQTPMSPNR